MAQPFFDQLVLDHLNKQIEEQSTAKTDMSLLTIGQFHQPPKNSRK